MAYFEPGAALASIGKASTTSSGPRLMDALVDSVPTSGIDAMAKNSVLPMMIFFGLIGWAARAQKIAAAPMLEFCDSLLAVIMRYSSYVMLLAPFGMVAAAGKASAFSRLLYLPQWSRNFSWALLSTEACCSFSAFPWERSSEPPVRRWRSHLRPHPARRPCQKHWKAWKSLVSDGNYLEW